MNRLEGLKKATNNLNQDKRCPGRYSSQTPAECKPTALLLQSHFASGGVATSWATAVLFLVGSEVFL